MSNIKQNVFHMFWADVGTLLLTLGPSGAGPGRPTVLQAHRPPSCPAKRPRPETCYFAEAAAYGKIEPVDSASIPVQLQFNQDQLSKSIIVEIDSGAITVTRPRTGVWWHGAIWGDSKKNETRKANTHTHTVSHTIPGNIFYSSNRV